VDYMNLPCPVPYEEVQREAFSKSRPPPPSFDLCRYANRRRDSCGYLLSFVAVSLKPEVFEGLRLDYAKMLNQSFGLTHR
jgi:mitochondrial import receptor subunit TOM40